MKTLDMDLTSPQFAALAALDENPRIDQTTLAGLIAFDRATIGGVVDRLVSKGFVERHINPKDRRARVLTLTAKGEATLKRLFPIVRKSQEAVLPGLTEEERQLFIKLADKVATAGNSMSRAPHHPPKAKSANARDTEALTDL